MSSCVRCAAAPASSSPKSPPSRCATFWNAWTVRGPRRPRQAKGEALLPRPRQTRLRRQHPGSAPRRRRAHGGRLPHPAGGRRRHDRKHRLPAQVEIRVPPGRCPARLEAHGRGPLVAAGRAVRRHRCAARAGRSLRARRRSTRRSPPSWSPSGESGTTPSSSTRPDARAAAESGFAALGRRCPARDHQRARRAARHPPRDRLSAAERPRPRPPAPDPESLQRRRPGSSATMSKQPFRSSRSPPSPTITTCCKPPSSTAGPRPAVRASGAVFSRSPNSSAERRRLRKRVAG